MRSVACVSVCSHSIIPCCLIGVASVRSYKFSQAAIADAVDQNTRSKIFDLQLKQFGPYRAKFSRDGRNVLLCGSKGHVASIDALSFKLSTEIHLRETTRDVQYLQNTTMFAVAQKKFVPPSGRSSSAWLFVCSFVVRLSSVHP